MMSSIQTLGVASHSTFVKLKVIELELCEGRKGIQSLALFSIISSALKSQANIVICCVNMGSKGAIVTH